jgi:isocitrate dehydrogenase
MSTGQSKITYTLTDEAPLLATVAFLPVIRSFAAPAGIEVEKADISVAARVLAEFGEYLTDAQKVPNVLGDLGRRTQLPETNIIKLPNISASVAQLVACVRELQSKGYKVPDYPEDARTDEQKAIKARYGKCIGSSVNPVLREGNSDRRSSEGSERVCAKESPFHGRMEPGVAHPCLAHAPR